jgi:glycerophosphoryl diester phosphodiesterase
VNSVKYSSTLIFAHRGASHDAPENTLSAYALGWEQRTDGLELDIHLTGDGHIVVMHGPDTHRTTGVACKIAEQTLLPGSRLPVVSPRCGWFAGRSSGLVTRAIGERVILDVTIKQIRWLLSQSLIVDISGHPVDIRFPGFQ